MFEKRNKLFLQILKSRLNEVNNRIESKNDYPSELDLTIIDKEECIRKLMVTIIPKIRIDCPDASKVEIFFSLMNQMKSPAMTNDYRFLDVWNHGYEAIIRWENISHKNNLQYFLIEYSNILKHHIKKLELG